MARRLRFRRATPRRARSLARRYYPRRFHRIRKGPLPILPIMGGVVAPMIRGFNAAGGMDNLRSNPMGMAQGFLDQMAQRYTGIALFPEMGAGPGFHIEPVIETYGGLLAGIVGHYVANRFGVNRYMKRIPFLGKWIAL